MCTHQPKPQSWINANFDLLCTCSFGEVIRPSKLVIFNSWLQSFSWFLNTALYSVSFVFPFPHFPQWLFQTYPHPPHSFFLLSWLPSSFSTDYISCLTEKSKAFKWETPQFPTKKCTNPLMFCSYSRLAFQLTVEEITFYRLSPLKLVFLLVFDSFVLLFFFLFFFFLILLF